MWKNVFESFLNNTIHFRTLLWSQCSWRTTEMLVITSCSTFVSHFLICSHFLLISASGIYQNHFFFGCRDSSPSFVVVKATLMQWVSGKRTTLRVRQFDPTSLWCRKGTRMWCWCNRVNDKARMQKLQMENNIFSLYKFNDWKYGTEILCQAHVKRTTLKAFPSDRASQWFSKEGCTTDVNE